MIMYRKNRVPRSYRERTLYQRYNCHPNCPHMEECIQNRPRCKHRDIRNGGLF